MGTAARTLTPTRYPRKRSADRVDEDAPLDDAGRQVAPIQRSGSSADTPAKQIVMALVADLGFDPIDTGPLAMSRYLEPLAMLWINLAYTQQLGPNIGFALLRR